MPPFDLTSDTNEVRLNPRMPADQAARLREWLSAAEGLTGHVFILTSGSTATSEADYKWVALSKAAILNAARASNAQLESDGRDVWLHGLPDFHVGGIGIWARAFLSGAKVVSFQDGWNPDRYAQAARDSGATLSSLVPTQVHDLVRQAIPSPPSLRGILVGGGALAEGLYVAARKLGWPILPTYGMSEAASQVATARLDSLENSPEGMPLLELLPHLEASSRPEDGRLRIRGDSLLTGYVVLGADGRSRLWDPKDREGWFLTEDLGTVDGRALTMHGRGGERIKIGGEIANLAVLRRTMDEAASAVGLAVPYALIALPDERLESVIALITEGEANVESAVGEFNQRVLPYERIREVRRVARIPRSELGKVKWAELSALVSSP